MPCQSTLRLPNVHTMWPCPFHAAAEWRWRVEAQYDMAELVGLLLFPIMMLVFEALKMHKCLLCMFPAPQRGIV